MAQPLTLAESADQQHSPAATIPSASSLVSSVSTPYLLTCDSDVEARRLQLLQQHHDPDSIAALERVGVRAGCDWRCLDVGTGGGSITRWLAPRVASVLATDLSLTPFGSETAPDNVTLRVHDITSAEPLPMPFDLVHTRLLLLHLPQRQRVLEHLVEQLRPGGWIVLGDIDFTPVSMLDPTDEWTVVWRAWNAATLAGGWSLNLGPQLQGMMLRAGLQHVAAESRGMSSAGGSTPLLVLSLALERLRARLIQHGATDAQISAARSQLEDPGRNFVAPVTWTAWGQRPAAALADSAHADKPAASASSLGTDVAAASTLR